MTSISRTGELRSTRRSLLDRLKNPDDADGWEQFTKQYTPVIRAIASRAELPSTDIDDVVQETLVTMWKKFRDGFNWDPAKGHFKHYLVRTVKSKIIDLYRKKKGHFVTPRTRTGGERRTATIERIPATSIDLDKICEAEWKNSVFDRALENVKHQVNGKHFQIYDLHVLKELPVSKVATLVGVNRGQIYLVKFRIARLIEEEKKRLERELF
jgi:RNA polymerase sigma-70 factor (ECF subfamily)